MYERSDYIMQDLGYGAPDSVSQLCGGVEFLGNRDCTGGRPGGHGGLPDACAE